ncbi:MAG: curli assembly protein CsgF [Paludibacter sp.]|nr:curli assembly protein CsgF [Paludibacter sp.]
MAACGPQIYQPLQTRRVILVPENTAKRNLINLSAPQGKAVTAVYKFCDQTRQYKASETGASWSTALPQETTTILVPTLEESGWFTPIERENLATLLNEHKVIRSSRTQYEGTDSNNRNSLPSLHFAGVIVEDGIILYNTDILIKGAGVQYFGATPSGVSDGIIRYVNPKHSIETETRYIYNQPTEKSATESIEKAVESLINKRVKTKSLELNDQNPTSHPYDGHYSDSLINSPESVNQQILSQLTRQIVAKQFGKEALSAGTYVMGDYQVVIGNQPKGMEMSITITDIKNESTATVSIPYF